jgi:Domain of unknown function (DUF1905)
MRVGHLACLALRTRAWHEQKGWICPRLGLMSGQNFGAALAFQGPLCHWRGPAPYYFVRVPPATVEELVDVAAEVTYGWGMLPVEVTVGGYTWEPRCGQRTGATSCRSELRCAAAWSLSSTSWSPCASPSLREQTVPSIQARDLREGTRSARSAASDLSRPPAAPGSTGRHSRVAPKGLDPTPHRDAGARMTVHL